MKRKFCISFFLFSFFSIALLAQSEGKKADTVVSAKQVILKNTGEKNLPQQLKEKQIKGQPEILKTDSLSVTNTVGKNVNRKSARCKKRRGWLKSFYLPLRREGTKKSKIEDKSFVSWCLRGNFQKLTSETAS